MSEEKELKSEKEGAKEYGEGLGCTFMLNSIVAGILFGLFSLQSGNNWSILIPLWFIGITQLVYMIPLIVVAYQKDQMQFAKGLIVGASITFLLNAACTAIFFSNFLH